MISGLFIYNHKGDCLISRIYRDNITRAVVDAFRVNVIHSRGDVRCPVVNIARTSYFHIKRNNMWLVAVTRSNSNAALIFEFLSKFVSLMEAYFTAFTDTNVKNNFSLIYELLDEILDFGYPQNTDAAPLKMYITQEGEKTSKSEEEQMKITSQVTGQIGWRRAGIKYRSHEIYLDVLESVSLLVSPTGGILSQSVAGVIHLKTQLSGMPECKFAMNDKLTTLPPTKDSSSDSKKAKKEPTKNPISIDDLTFHQCVKLGSFNTDRTITFVPPDGDFDLMKYRTTQDIIAPFSIFPAIQENGNILDIIVNLKANFGLPDSPTTQNGADATKIEIIIPVPTTTAKANVETNLGKAKYKPGANAIIWKIPRCSGGKSAACKIKIELLGNPADRKKWTKPPISVNFEVPFSCSGLSVRYLKISERALSYDDTAVKKWVRYVSRSGEYEIRY